MLMYRVCYVTSHVQALQEFTSLCGEEPREAVLANLNVWVLMYNKLSMVRSDSPLINHSNGFGLK